MAAITQLVIKGYQSHVNTEINLSPGLTVITGPSDAGKTAILRALRWLAFGEPTGEAFVNEKVGLAFVAATLEDGTSVAKHRHKGKTTYTLLSPGWEQAQEFEKAEVPQEVTAALGLLRQSFGDFETQLNFAYQLEAPFLLSESPSAGAKVLGKLAGTEVVDRAIKAVSKDTYQARQDKLAAEKELERINGDLRQYAELDDLKEQLEACQYLISEVDQAYDRLNNLEHTRDRLVSVQDDLDSLADKLERLAVVPEIAKDIEDVEGNTRRYEKLLELYGAFHKAQDDINRLGNTLKQYEGVEEAQGLINGVECYQTDLAALKEKDLTFGEGFERLIDAQAVLDNLEDLPQPEDLQALEVTLAHIERLQILGSSYGLYEGQVTKYQAKLAELEGLDDTAAAISLSDQLLHRKEKLVDHYSEWQAASLDVILRTKDLDVEELRLRQASEELEAAWEAVGGICPLCDSPVDSCKHEGGEGDLEG